MSFRLGKMATQPLCRAAQKAEGRPHSAMKEKIHSAQKEPKKKTLDLKIGVTRKLGSAGGGGSGLGVQVRKILVLEPIKGLDTKQKLLKIRHFSSQNSHFLPFLSVSLQVKNNILNNNNTSIEKWSIRLKMREKGTFCTQCFLAHNAKLNF